MRILLITVPLILLSACSDSDSRLEAERLAKAQQFFQGIYGCNPSVVDELGAEDVVMSYPIFQELYNTPAFRGRQAVREFATGFCARWENARFTFHESVTENDRVVLIWSFSARFVGPNAGQPGFPPADQDQSWGGISLFRFNNEGKIVAEIGEESTPGPYERTELPE